jgi:hypothetical protein
MYLFFANKEIIATKYKQKYVCNKAKILKKQKNKNPINPNKTQKNPPGWVLKKTRVFANPASSCYSSSCSRRVKRIGTQQILIISSDALILLF